MHTETRNEALSTLIAEHCLEPLIEKVSIQTHLERDTIRKIFRGDVDDVEYNILVEIAEELGIKKS